MRNKWHEQKPSNFPFDNISKASSILKSFGKKTFAFGYVANPQALFRSFVRSWKKWNGFIKQ